LLASSDPAPGGPAATPTTLVLVLGGPLDRHGLDTLCDRTRALCAATGAEMIVCDLGDAAADGVSIDAIGRLKLNAERAGRSVRFVYTTRELGELLRFAGLEDIFDLDEFDLDERELTVDPQG
jgi:thiamine monophosphate kinase